MKPKSPLITSPNGTILNAHNIVAVSPVFKSVELGCAGFAVYTTADGTDPFLFAARDGKKDLHAEFVHAWESALSTPDFRGN